MKYYFTLWINFRFLTLLFQQVLTANLIKLFYWWILGEGPTYPTTDPFFQFHVFYFKFWPKKARLAPISVSNPGSAPKLLLVMTYQRGTSKLLSQVTRRIFTSNTVWEYQ